jgi:hypothetical protein
MKGPVRFLAKAMAVLGVALAVLLVTATIGFFVTYSFIDGSQAANPGTDLGAPIGFGMMVMFVSLPLSVYVGGVLAARLFAGIGLREFFLGAREA